MAELRCHTAEAIPEGARGRVRELHLSHTQAEGASYARHLALRLYAGEEYVLQVGPARSPHPTANAWRISPATANPLYVDSGSQLHPNYQHFDSLNVIQ